MNIRFFLLLSFMTLSLWTSNAVHAGAPPALNGQPGAPGVPMSPEDLKMLQELQEVEQEINKFVGSLPAEEQKKFWQEVDELTQVMSNMSEEELVKFMENVLQEQEAGIKPPFTPAPSPAPTQPVFPEFKPVSTPTSPMPIASDKQQQAFKMIESIVIMLNNFLTKVQALPEIAGKIESWIKEGKIRGAHSQETWHTLRGTIESLIAKLNKVKDRDPQTGTLKYLDELVKNEALVNNLAKFRDVLNKYQPQIEISPFGIEKMNETTRSAVRTVINSIIEATTLMGIPAGLNAVIEKYEPMAKQLREKEEQAQRRAYESAQRPIRPTSASLSSRPEQPFVERKPAYTESSTPKYVPFAPPTKPQEETPKDEKGKKEAADKKGTAGGKGGKEDAGKDGKGSGDKGKDDQKKLEIEDKESADYYKGISENLNRLGIYLEDHGSELNKGGEADDEVLGDLQSAYKASREAVFNVRQLKRRITAIGKTKPALRTTYKKMIEGVLKDNDKFLKTLPAPDSAGGPYKEIVDKISTKVEDLRKAIKEL